MKNNSKRIVLLMVVFMVLILSSNSFAANEQPHVIQGVKVYIDGTLFQTESPFYNLNGFTLVPMRAIFEGLGAKVKWEQSTKTIVASTEERIIELTIDKDIAKINDKNHSLTVAPKLINNTTYVPLRFIAEALMYEVDWDSSNRVISIIDTRAISKVWQNRVDIYDGVIDLADIDLCEEDLLRLNILKDGQRVDIDYNVIGTKIVFKTELKLNTNYALRVITNEDKYEIRFTTGDLPEIYETGDRIIVKVPAMPEKGFNWPYYLAIPSNHYKNENQNNKRYLMVDTTNGGEKDLQGTEKWVYDTLENRYQYSVSVAEFLWTPMIMPVFPRTSVWYHDKYGEYNVFYEHALDRDTATLHNKVKDPEMRKMLEPLYKEKGFNIDDFLRLDKQLVAMFNHAVGYLNKYGYNVETDKMFLCGFSASGMFANRFTAFQPDKVKAVASQASQRYRVPPELCRKRRNGKASGLRRNINTSQVEILVGCFLFGTKLKIAA